MGGKGENTGGVRNVTEDDETQVGRVGHAWAKYRKGDKALTRCETVFPVSVVVGAAVPAAVCR